MPIITGLVPKSEISHVPFFGVYFEQRQSIRAFSDLGNASSGINGGGNRGSVLSAANSSSRKRAGTIIISNGVSMAAVTT